MTPLTVIPIILAIAVIPPVLEPDLDPLQLIEGIIPSFKVACAEIGLCELAGGGNGINCVDEGCTDAGGECELDPNSVNSQVNNGGPSCMCKFPAVGGWFFEVDEPAILVAGAQYTAAWMIPVIVSAAGFGLVL